MGPRLQTDQKPVRVPPVRGLSVVRTVRAVGSLLSRTQRGVHGWVVAGQPSYVFKKEPDLMPTAARMWSAPERNWLPPKWASRLLELLMYMGRSQRCCKDLLFLPSRPVVHFASRV